MKVIIDIGASGKIPKFIKKQLLDAFYIGIDRSDIQVKAKKVKLYERVVVAPTVGWKTMYVTNSPWCSSLLKPCISQKYYESHKFQINWEVSVVAITLADIIRENNLEHIDILKLDTQGLDLSILKSCPIQPEIVMLEPGIINAYEGEDKLSDIFKWLEDNNYECLSMKTGYLHKNLGLGKLNNFIGKVPAWLEMTYKKK